MDERENARRLTAAAFGDGASVAGVAPIAGDASARRYWRVALSGGPVNSIVLMNDPSQASPELTGSADDPVERFARLAETFAAGGVAVPRVHVRDGRWLLLEDVGDESLAAALAATDEDGREALLGAAIDELVRIQRLPVPDGVALPSFDAALYRAELEHFLDYGDGGRSFPESFRREAVRRFDPFVDELASTPRVVAHRDYHCWNLHVERGRIRVLDFQDALYAARAYDLASLLTDRTTPTIVGADLSARLVDRFADALDVPAENRAPLCREVALAALHRALKVIGRFHFLEVVKGKPGYRPFVPHSARTATRALEALPDEKPLADLLLPVLSGAAR